MAGFIELYKAVESDNTYEVCQLVHDGIDINVRDSMKRTALHHAAQQLNKKMAELLVRLGAEVNATDIERRTPLHYFLLKESTSYTVKKIEKDCLFMVFIHLCSPEERTQIVQSRFLKEITGMIDCLHRLGADLNASFDENVTSLHEAVRRKNIPAIDVLTRLGVDINIMKKTGRRAVSLMISEKEVLKHLVRLGADVSFVHKSRTALNDAVEMGRLDIVEILTERGADVNVLNMNNISPIIEAVQTDITDLEIYKCLVQLGADMNLKCSRKIVSVIHEAVKLKETKILKYLVQQGASISKAAEFRLTPIGLAVNMFKYEELECLVNCGANINQRYDTCVPVLINAIRERNIEMVKLLVNLDAKIDSFVSEGIDAICSALVGQSVTTRLPKQLGPGMDIKRTPSMVRMLLRLGADVNARYDPLVPIVHDVVARNDVTMIQVLGQLGANMNIPMNEGLTILNVALHMKFAVDVVKLLIEEGADINARYNDMVSPLHHAVDVVKLLIEEGADINARYNDMVSPLHHAVRLSSTQMAQSLIQFGAKIDNNCLSRGVTALNQAVKLEETVTVNMFLKHGADVNVKSDWKVAPIHIAVACGDAKMIQVLSCLGANLNIKRHEETILSAALNKYGFRRQLDIIRALIAAGADLNEGNKEITALHDAVKVDNPKIVETLAHLGADMNCRKFEGIKPFHIAVVLREGWQEIIECFAEQGADMNMSYEVRVTPLHDAICLGNTAMVECLGRSGASVIAGKQGQTAMQNASVSENTELMKYLVKVGVDVNATYSKDISAIHIAHEHGNGAMIDLCICLGLKEISNKNKGGTWFKNIPSARMRQFGTLYFFTKKIERVSLLHECLLMGDKESIECLLSLGINVNQKQNLLVSPCDKDYRKLKLFHHIDQVGSSPLHTACSYGNTDAARLLIIAGSNCNMIDHHELKPLQLLPLANTTRQLLPLASTGTIDYHVLQEAATTRKVIEDIGNDTPSVVLCQNTESIHSTPGLGNVQYIFAPNSRDISESIHEFLQIMLYRCKIFSKAKLKGCGSANEGTRVGLPTEMDFLFVLELPPAAKRNIINAGRGYVHYVNPISKLCNEGSKSFHNTFVTEISEAISYLRAHKIVEKVTPRQYEAAYIQDSNRKACSLLVLRWGGESSGLRLYISVDTVPCLHVDNWPEGAINNTWMMENQDLRQKGYILVPKPPHVRSDLAKHYSTTELQALWRISFAHLEREHMQRLGKRVKDVYVTAKSLRNPDVCRIMITDEGSMPRNVDRYLTSYHLKMMFLKNVENFLNSDQSLGAMVCKVFDDLEVGLSERYIPLFFMPSVNVLDGLKLNIPKCAEVAKIMKRFVWALYLRDCQEDATDSDADEEIIVYQRKPRTVYRSIEISP